VSGGIVVVKIPDPAWGEPRIARAVGNDRDPWGVLSVLRETPWEPLIPLIPSTVFDQALRGHATPLMRLLGPPPTALVKRLPAAYTECRDNKGCINASPLCIPGKRMPDCWASKKLLPEAVEVASSIARLWKDKIAVVVLVPEE